jgi:hypothetical protein
MNKSILLSFGMMLMAQSAFASTPHLLTTYGDILNALKSGHEMKAVIDLEKCSSNSSAKMKALLNLRVGMHFDYFIDTVTPDTGRKVIKTTATKLYRSYAMPGFYQLYAELETFEDGSVQMYGALVNPVTFVSVAEVNYQCHLSTNTNEQGLKVFDLT